MTATLRKVRLEAERSTGASQRRDDAIRAAHEAGASIRAIAVEAGLSAARVHQILHGK